MKRTLQALIILLLVPMLCRGAIAFGNKNSNGGLAASSGTTPWTNSASGNALALAGVAINNASVINATNITLKMNGTNMGSCVCTRNDGTSQMIYFWVLPNPPTTGGSVIATFGSTVTAWALGVVSFTGVDQSNPVDGTNAVSFGTVTNWAITNNISNAGAWTVDLAYKHLVTGTFTPGGSQTSIDDAAIGSAFWASSSYQGPCNGTKATNTWTCSIASDGLLGCISLKPAATSTPQMPLLGTP